jgi:hypothetical protein
MIEDLRGLLDDSEEERLDSFATGFIDEDFDEDTLILCEAINVLPTPMLMEFLQLSGVTGLTEAELLSLDDEELSEGLGELAAKAKGLLGKVKGRLSGKKEPKAYRTPSGYEAPKSNWSNAKKAEHHSGHAAANHKKVLHYAAMAKSAAEGNNSKKLAHAKRMHKFHWEAMRAHKTYGMASAMKGKTKLQKSREARKQKKAASAA